MPKIDVPEVLHKSTKSFVTVPATDLFDQPFATIRLGKLEFLAGQTYELEEPTASSLKERIAAWEKANIRILQPRKDIKAERAAGMRAPALQAAPQNEG